MTVTHLVLIGLLALCLIILYAFIKFNTTVRQDIYEWFIVAEKNFSVGSEKMEYVLDNTYEFLPIVIKVFVSRKNYEKIVQYLFDCIKNLLDDGKMN